MDPTDDTIDLRRRQLWAPWRLAYIADNDKLETDEGCFLCRYAKAGNDAQNFVIARGPNCMTVLNRYPYNNGHLLISPYQHKATLDDLTDGELFECARELRRMTRILRGILNSDGFNVGLNLGAAAGAGVPGHLHWHIVPRWNGDTNFMPVLGNVKVIPQSLEALFEFLVDAIAKE